MISSPEVVEFDEPSRLGNLARDWLGLATRLDDTSYFQTPDWILSWWATIAERPPTRAAAWRAASGRLEALVVLSRDRVRLHPRLALMLPVYTNAGSGAGAADHCSWLVPPAWRDEVAAWLSQTLGGAGLLLRSADPDWDRPPLPGSARVVERTVCPRMSVPPPDRDVGRTHAFDRQLRRLIRRMQREGVVFEWIASASMDEPLLRTLFELHAGVRARHGSGTSFGIEQLTLHRRLAERSGPGRGPAAVVATRSGTVVGVLYGFVWKDTFAAYQWGWDARWDRHSMGSVLAYQAIRFAASRGVRTFDFLRGTEPYKYRFGAVDRCDRTWLVPHGPLGALLAARYRATEVVHRSRAGDAAVRRPRQPAGVSLPRTTV
jgi:CelD/BcsL family acetyltransferase involved in cellulose biosynthesis